MRPTLTQAEVFKMVLASLFLGVLLGALYDLFTAFRIFRKSEKSGKKTMVIDVLLCFFEDIIFFLLVSAANVVLFSAYGGSKVRLEGIISEFIAFSLWHISVGKLAAAFAKKVKKAVKRILRAVYNKTVKPIMGMLRRRLEGSRRKREQKAVRRYSAAAKTELKRRLRQNEAIDQR